MTATMTTVAEKRVVIDLAMKKTAFRISESPVSPRLSFHASNGELNHAYIGKLVNEKGVDCPRMIIFEAKLDNCGRKYVQITQVIYLYRIYLYRIDINLIVQS